MLLGPKTVAFRKSAVREMTMAPKNRIKWQIATEKRKTQESPPWLFFALLIFSPVFNSCFVSVSEQLPLHRPIFFRQKLRKSSLSYNLPDFLLVRSFFSIFEILMFSGDRCRPHQTTVFRWFDLTEPSQSGLQLTMDAPRTLLNKIGLKKKSLEAVFWKIWKDCCLITSMMDRCASDR